MGAALGAAGRTVEASIRATWHNIEPVAKLQAKDDMLTRDQIAALAA